MRTFTSRWKAALLLGISVAALAGLVWAQIPGAHQLGGRFEAVLLAPKSTEPTGTFTRGAVYTDTSTGMLMQNFSGTNFVGVGVVGPAANTVPRRDGSGRLEAADPDAGQDVVTFSYFEANAASGGLKYYIESNTANGANADTNCDTDYRLCRLYEWIGREYDISKDVNQWSGDIWFDSDVDITNSGETGLRRDCGDWTLSDFSRGSTVSLVNTGSGTIPNPYGFSALVCSQSRKTICCEEDN